MRLTLAALAFFAFATPAAADRFSLSYNASGMGVVPLGDMTIDAFVSEEDYQVNATLNSGGLMNLFERTNIRVSSSGVIQGGDVFWHRYDLDHRYSRKHRVIAMTNASGIVSAEIVPNYRLWGEPPATDEERTRSRDPLSTLVAMAIDVGQTRRCSGIYPTFDGRFHYLLELNGGEIDDFDGGGYEGDVLKCRLAYIAVSGFERRDAGRRRIPQGSVWFALAPNTFFAPPVRISTPMSAGGAVIRLSSWRRAAVDIDTTAASP